MPKKKLTIYFAAGLSSLSDRWLNINMTTIFEARGHIVVLPQRDGYEFTNLTRTLQKKLSPGEAEGAIRVLIYLLDMGIFIPKSDAVVARYDEPLDSGVDVEATYSFLMGKPVVGYRTDSRTPYGSFSEPLGGTHFFPAHQCHEFVRHQVEDRSLDMAADNLVALADKILTAIGVAMEKSKAEDTAAIPHKVAELIGLAKLLFEEIPDIHSTEGLETVVDRYLQNKRALQKLVPAFI